MEETKEMYMDGYLKSNLDITKEAIKKDMDFVICVDGMERSGKSLLAQQCAKYCDPTFNINRICFTPEEFETTVKAAEPYQAIVFDEAYTGFLAANSMGTINKTLIRMIAEIGQKNLFIFIVMPTFFDLQRYIALWRSRALIHVYFGENFQRGFFTFFNSDKKKDLYINGKKYYNYNIVKSNFYGRFTNYYTVNEEEYRKKKREALNKHKIDEPKGFDEDDIKKAIFIKLLNHERPMSNKEKSEIIGITEKTYYKWLNDYRKDSIV